MAFFLAAASAAASGGAGPSPAETDLYCEALRPQFHFSARRGWINDPVGLLRYDGEYHLFFQHTPGLPRSMARTYWGHAVGADLVHWKQLDNAFGPRGGHPAFSGSAVVDANNTAGLQTGRHKPLVAIYTAWGKGQDLAYSNDRGRTWRQYKNNPVLALPGDELRSFPRSARDPKVFWHEPTRKWVLVLYQNDGGKEGFGFYGSPDLKTWTRLGHLPGFYVCPDLFELPVTDRTGRRGDTKHWVIMDWAKYAIGRFDGNTFTPEAPARRLDYGPGYSANQTWNNMPPTDGRRVQIAWLRYGKYPGMPFDQQLTFPCELSLRELTDGVRLCRLPIAEISKLYARTDRRADLAMTGKPLAMPVGELLDVSVEFDLGGADEVGLVVRGARIAYDAKAELVRFGKSAAPAGRADGRLTLRVLLDRASVEIFVNDGQATITQFFTPAAADRTLGFFSRGGRPKVRELVVHELRSAWRQTPDPTR